MKIFTLIVFCLFTGALIAQERFEIRNPDVIEATFLGETAPLRDFVPDPNYVEKVVKPERLGYHPKKNWPLHESVNPNALPKGDDPALQKNYTPSRGVKDLEINMTGLGYTFVNPSDPNADVGSNHVIQMTNGGGTQYQIWDKSGNSLFGPASFAATIGGTGSGDPIVLYDQLADRWLMSEFGPGNSLFVAVSTTPDPLGPWFTYTFITPNFPDYPKYAVWPDAYYVTTNESNPAVYALDRVAMLAGNPATSQRFSTTNYPTIGFQSNTPVALEGMTVPPPGTPAMFMCMADDAWSASIPNDRLEIYELTIDFATPSNSVLAGPTFLATDPFDTELNGYTAFSAFPQPGSPITLDPLREVLMYQVQYRNFGTHESIVCNHVTDVDGNDWGGVRWYELRKSGGDPWTIYQQGTYAPDADNRWMGAIAINGLGDIGLMYNITSETTYPGIRYTGRKVSDPLGTMTEAETIIGVGLAANGSNRYGDYNSLSVDPSDELTFWGTAQYNPASQWSTKIAAFTLEGGIPCSYSNIVYVDKNAAGLDDGSSWDDAFNKLQDAISFANSCDVVNQIWVAAGTYYPDEGAGYTDNDRNHSFIMKNNLAIYGGFTGGEASLTDRPIPLALSTLSGDIDQNDGPDFANNSENSFHVINNENNNLDATAVLDGFTISGGNADGNNSAINVGGGMRNYYSSPMVVNCTFEGNKANYAGGGMHNLQASPQIINCIFKQNTSVNWGGGLECEQSSHATVVNCSFSGNSAGAEGGSIDIYFDSSPTIISCISWGNSSEISISLNSFPNISNSIIAGGCPANATCTDLLDMDPLFVDQPAIVLGSTGDLRLQQCSPAINTGDNTAVPAGITTDLDGNPRFFDNGIVDMGAYELQSSPPGDPDEFGDNVWNVYVWNAGGIEVPNTEAWNLNYSGYYVEDNLSFDTEARWNQATAPSDADGYVGCPVDINYHSFSYKRKGFPENNYVINVDNHDDAAQLFVNGTNVWEHNGCCDSHPAVWEGTLGAGDEVEFRVTEAGGGSLGKLSFVPGDSDEFGDNVWNVYAWNAGGAEIPNNEAWNLNYSGYYIESNLSFDTETRWPQVGAPSDADGYSGVPVGVSNHSFSYKRKGFPEANYAINVDNHDDAAQLFINGTNVWEHNGCCDVHPGVWEGALGADDEVEFRVTEGGGGSLGKLSFVECPTTDILFVDTDATGNNDGTSWDDAFNFLQDALYLGSSCPGVSQIWVATGTYYPDEGDGYADDDRTHSFTMGNNLAIYGGFEGVEAPGYDLDLRDFTINESILSGDIGVVNDTADNSYHVVSNYNTYLDNTAIIDGFTITGGNANGISPNHVGGGIINNNSSPTISNCIIMENYALSGAGLYNYGPLSTVTLSSCSFIGNGARNWGGGVYSLSVLSFNNCTIAGNSSTNAGGIFIANSNLEMINTSISNNFTASQASAINLQDCPVSTLTNCLISGNVSENNCGGILNFTFNGSGSVLNLINSTIAKNISVEGYPAVWTTGNMATTNLKNTLVANNDTYSFYTAVNSFLVSQGNNLDSDSTSGFTHGVNGDILGFDPLFVGGDDCRLQACSPAIDAGNNTDAPLDDLDGNPRPFSPMGYNPATVDIGCYEYSVSTDICATCPALAFAGDDNGVFPGDAYTFSDATAENYLSVNWSTSGDGFFSNPDTLSPTYTPGPNDIAAGGVELTLSIEGLNSCGIGDSDQMTLSIYHPPTLEITYPFEGDVLYDFSLTVEGIADDINNDLYEVYVQLNGGGWELATGTDIWSHGLNLVIGENLIQAKALDAQNLESDVAAVNVLLSVQVIPLAQGWSIISSYLTPLDPTLELVMADLGIPANLTIMLGKNGIYWPEHSINTIGDWNVFEGYKVKNQLADELIMHGDKLGSNDVTFSEGFHVIPVLSDVPALISQIFADPENDVMYIFDLTSGLIYWPQGGIMDLVELLPGRGYLASFNKEVSINYPDYSGLKSGAIYNTPHATNDGPWDYSRTSKVHQVSISHEAAAEFKDISHIGAFDANDYCIGSVEINHVNGNYLLTVFGDDETTTAQDGAIDGEYLTFKAYNPIQNVDYEIIPEFSDKMPVVNGEFKTNGMSMIIGFKDSSTGIGGASIMALQVELYPNPARDLVTLICQDYTPDAQFEAEFVNADGKVAKKIQLSGKSTNVDLNEVNPGVYFVKITSQSGTVIKKLVIQ